MKYCKDCRFFSGRLCDRPVDHPVYGPSYPLGVHAEKQRVTYPGVHYDIGGYVCGPLGRYWEKRPANISKIGWP
jgi:hypothetical protein